MHGVKESKNEDTDTAVTETLNELLQEKLTDFDIDWSRWIERLKNVKQSRSIIIKFARYNIRNRVFKDTNKQKGTRFFQWQEDINAVVLLAFLSTKPCLSFLKSLFLAKIFGKTFIVAMKSTSFSYKTLTKAFHLPIKTN